MMKSLITGITVGATVSIGAVISVLYLGGSWVMLASCVWVSVIAGNAISKAALSSGQRGGPDK